MAEHMIETRILLRYDTYSNWMNSNVILKQGEAAIANFPYQNTIISSNNQPDNTPPAIGIKIGDGIHYFRELPWVQAIAADVYNWAKNSTKPQYTAQEIYGLQNFVENLITGDTNITIAPRIYQLVRGTDTNINKYYLRYKENNEQSEWIIDTSTYIDLSDLVTLSNWIGNDINLYSTLGDRTEEHIQYDLSRIKVVDNEQSNYVVTSVSQEKGKISTTKRALSFSDITNILPVSQGGTGKTSLTKDEVLIGNGTEAITSIPIATTITTNNDLVPNYLIKAYVDNATAGITGAMHFIGEATVVINPNSTVDPRISGYNFANAQLGDVILYDYKEYVWDGTWRLLGDEGSYAIKGSIRDVDIDAEAAIQQSKIAGLDSTLNTKVDKIEGKVLSSNDFTDELKQKLEDIGTNAETNVIEHIFFNDNEILPTTINSLPKSINLQVKEFDDFSAQKLAGIQAGAQANIIEKIIYNGEQLTPDVNKVITITPDPHTEHENKIESIIINGIEQIPDKNKQVKITIDDAALNLQVIKGARVPNGGLYEDVDITQDKKLELSRIAKTGNINDIIQTSYTYVTLDCGSSTEVL